MNNLENKIGSERVGKLLRCALLGGASVLTVGAFSTPALAQDAAASTASPEIETVVVTGILGSLQRDLDIKRNSLGLVDAISAEDIGKFPDSDLAAAMQRIPGVTISRSQTGAMGNNLGGTSANGDATQITVRGFGPTFEETLYDGRQVSTAIKSRAFDFSEVSADFVKEIDVMKSPDASLSAGAIGATVNIQFPKPFDHPGLKVVGSVSTTFNPDYGSPTPNADVLISDTFANDTIGILADASYQDTRTSDNHVNVQAWYGTHFAPSQFAGAAPGASTTPSVVGFAIQDYGIYHDVEDEVRENSRFVVQWRPSDALEVTVNDDFGRDRIHQNQYGFSVWFNQGSLQNIVENKNQTLTSFDQPNTPTDFQGTTNLSVVQNNEAGINLHYVASDKLSIILDYDFAESWLNPGGESSGGDADVGYGGSGPGGTCYVGGAFVHSPACNSADVGIAGVGIGELPFPTGIGPNGNAADFLGAGILGSHVFPQAVQLSYDAVNQAKVEADWTEEHLQFKVGVQYMSDHNGFETFDDFANNDWQAYAGYGAASSDFYAPSVAGTFVPVATTVVTNVPGTASQTGAVGAPGSITVTTTGSTTTTTTFSTVQPGDPGYNDPNCPLGVNGGNPCPAGATLPQGLFTKSFATAGYVNGFGNSNALPTRILEFKPGPVKAYLESLGNPQTSFVPGADKTCCNPPFNGKYQLALANGTFQHIYEDNMAAYISMAEETTFDGMPLKINLGLRDEETAVRSFGIGALPTKFTVQAGDHTAFQVDLGAPAVVSESNRYTHLLPNMDMKLDLTDDLRLTFDASRTLTKPPLANLSPVQSLGATRVGTVSANGGNPQLQPFVADNVDVGVEYYYAPNSYLSIDGYDKNVSNFLNNQALPRTFAGVIDPTTGAPVQYTLDSVANGPSAKVDGVEIALQHVFDDSGWGLQANATIVGTNTPYNPHNLASVTPFALAGLSNSANFVGFYDKDGFQARVAVTYRASQLLQFGQIQGGSAFGTEPVFVNSSTQVDFSSSYDLTDNLSLYFVALNLNDATVSTHGRFAEQVLDVNDFGRSFRLGVHWKL